ncbi:MAG: response regulator [Bacteroidetes bacterium]|jgi:DNA-binding LytR/AlgR family response regulator|nr:response regulator [Bacteroidota bacterium]
MIRSLIVDDEPIACRVLAAHLRQIPDVEIVAQCTNALEALRLVREEAVDLVFLDIEMPTLNGIGFVEAIDPPPHVIFTTAHRDYALDGFELDAVDYLLKPIGFPRLVRAVEKYRRRHTATDDSVEKTAEEATAPTLNIRVDRRTVRVALPAIRYIESLSDYVVVHTDTDAHTTKERIRDLAEQLAPHGFIRIHRSFLVAPWHVNAFTAQEVQISDQTLSISRTYRKQALARLREDEA